MEKYKKSLIHSCIKMAILSALLVVVFLLFCTSVFEWLFPNIHNSNKDFSSMGVSVLSFVGAAIGNIVTWLRAIKNPEKLNAMYIKTNDERELLIQQKTGLSTFEIIIYLLLMAMVISNRINSDIFFTLLAVIIVMLVIYGVSNIYYRKRF